MSWQRIDEITYIDDTLVTCAEYQLFIDEMHDQGEYYQPDHWTSYRFQKGTAGEPILGARLSDAKEFCKWITKRAASAYFFRLPVSVEAQEYHLYTETSSPYGYWASDGAGTPLYFWNKAVPSNPHKLDRSHITDLIRACDLARYSKISLTAIIDPDYNLARKLVLEGAIPLSFDLDKDFTTGLFLDHDFELALDHDRGRLRALDQARKLASNRDLSADRNLNLIHATSLVDDFAVALEKILQPLSKRNRYLDRDRQRSLARARYLSTNIYILQERIAGRSLAFEGIRLVKERIK